MIRHIIPKGDLSAEHKRLVKQEIDDLPDDKPWLVQVTRYVRKRTLEQNSFLHAVPLKLISEHTGHEVEDLKTYLLGMCFGWAEYVIFDQQRRRPVKRSSDLNTEEFGYFLDFIEQWAAHELDMIIPRPGEIIT